MNTFRIVSHIQISLLLLLYPAATYCTSVTPKSTSVTYKSASVTPYYTDDKGNTFFLLGKEYRGRQEFWYNFGGNKDRQDAIESAKLNIEAPLFTAQRETQEETAGQLTFKKVSAPKPWYMAANPEEGFWVEDTKPSENYSVGYFLPIEYIDPKTIENAAKKLTSSQYAHLEKNAWVWVNAQDFMNWIMTSDFADYQYSKLDAPIFPIYKVTLQIPKIQKYIQKIIDTGRESVLKKTSMQKATVVDVAHDLKEMEKILLKHSMRPTFFKWYDQYDDQYNDGGESEADYTKLWMHADQVRTLGAEENTFIDTYLKEYDKKSLTKTNRDIFVKAVTELGQKLFKKPLALTQVQRVAIDKELKAIEELGPDTVKALKAIMQRNSALKNK